MKKFLMGNEAIAWGAMQAGVNLVCGYPGTPSTEILETAATINDGSIYVEWSVNEKAAMEIAAGASYAGARTMVTMKQVGLNVASDPLMSLAYIGVRGGMVVVTADDPGPISSQTEQDTRHFAQFSKLPVFDPASPEEAYEMVSEAFALSEKYGTPVILRPTTRVCHGCASMEIADSRTPHDVPGFEKKPDWVIFPRLSYMKHAAIEARNPLIGGEFSDSRFNRISGSGKKGIATGGISFQYVREALGDAETRLLKVGTPHPFPEKLALQFLDGLEEVMVIEELDPVIERELIFLCGKHCLPVKVRGKLSGDVQAAGENSVESVKDVLRPYISAPAASGEVPISVPIPVPNPVSDTAPAAPDAPGAASNASPAVPAELPPLPVRPPVLCAGCPHRASFYAVKQAMKGQKAVFSGDIGCYTLGNAQPLDMVDTCLCMGAGITIAQGLQRAEPGVKHFAFIGDSTFFASGITGIINAVYNQTDITLIVLDNSTTAMTGHQPHPGTGKTMMGSVAERISIPAILEAIGIRDVQVLSPMHLGKAVEAVKRAAAHAGVSAIVFKYPCIAVTKPLPTCAVDRDACTGCRKCIRELGCPAISMDGKKAVIEPSLCYGCSLCTQVCPAKAIKGGKKA